MIVAVSSYYQGTDASGATQDDRRFGNVRSESYGVPQIQTL
jgi:hypothetical protein